MHAETTHLMQTPAAAEFERQLATLVADGYPWSAGLTDEQFRELLAPLAARAAALPWPDDDVAPADDDPAALSRRIPFVLVAPRSAAAYLIVGVDCGWEPLPVAGEPRRSPLTLEEAIAVVALFPAAVTTDGPPHAWLGSASCERRVRA